MNLLVKRYESFNMLGLSLFCYWLYFPHEMRIRKALKSSSTRQLWKHKIWKLRICWRHKLNFFLFLSFFFFFLFIVLFLCSFSPWERIENIFSKFLCSEAVNHFVRSFVFFLFLFTFPLSQQERKYCSSPFGILRKVRLENLLDS